MRANCLCGGLVELIQNGFETLTEAGYPPEMAYFELHEVINCRSNLWWNYNMNYSFKHCRVWRIRFWKKNCGQQTKDKMREVLKDIQSGKFTKQWMDEHKSGQKLLKMRQDLAKHPIEKVGKELRAMMPWIENKLVDKDKN